MSRLGPQLDGINRCPHCSVANPVLQHLWHTDTPLGRATPGPTFYWAIYQCTSCGSIVLARGSEGTSADPGVVTKIFPEQKSAHADIPMPARSFLQQAFETLHAPDAAAVMAGSAVDSMLKILGYVEGALYSRIDKAVEEHKLTKEMGDWAHEVRLGSNRPRHADAKKPHISAEEAEQSVDFAEALGNFLFVLSSRIKRGTEAAKAASAP
jgi:Domain of unknown function (DUF4145)